MHSRMQRTNNTDNRAFDFWAGLKIVLGCFLCQRNENVAYYKCHSTIRPGYNAHNPFRRGKRHRISDRQIFRLAGIPSIDIRYGIFPKLLLFEAVCRWKFESSRCCLSCALPYPLSGFFVCSTGADFYPRRANIKMIYRHRVLCMCSVNGELVHVLGANRDSFQFRWEYFWVSHFTVATIHLWTYKDYYVICIICIQHWDQRNMTCHNTIC